MHTIELPKANEVAYSITFDDIGIEPDYIEDRSYDNSCYNEYGCPIIRLSEPYYNAKKRVIMNKAIEEAKKQYEDWIKNAPWFLNIKLK